MAVPNMSPEQLIVSGRATHLFSGEGM